MNETINERQDFAERRDGGSQQRHVRAMNNWQDIDSVSSDRKIVTVRVRPSTRSAMNPPPVGVR